MCAISKVASIVVLVLFFVISLGNAEKNLVREDDLKFINFVKDENYKLQVDVSKVLREVNVINEHLCSLACVDNDQCVSANYKTTGNGACQLLKTDKYQEGQVNMVTDNTFKHMSIKTPCDSSPCLNSGTCVPSYEDGSYKCTCGMSHTGSHCETEVPWKGFEQSSIIGSNTQYLQLMLQWISSTPANGAQWGMCFSTKNSGSFSSADFHSACDSKQYTITVVQVGDYIFGGYSDLPWVSGGSYYASTSCWLFSLRNSANVAPFRTVSTKSSTHAVYSSPSYGPTFGGGHDLYIATEANINTNSYTNLGHTYQPPRGYTYNTDPIKALLAGTFKFSVTNYEVFYKK